MDLRIESLSSHITTLNTTGLKFFILIHVRIFSHYSRHIKLMTKIALQPLVCTIHHMLALVNSESSR